MFRPRVIVVLLLKGAGLVKTIQFKKPKYIGDPINAVKIFNDLEADELIFLDIEASKQKRSPNFTTIKKIADEAFMPFAFGGGISSLEEARQVISCGAEKVIINTAMESKPALVKEISDVFGKQSVMVSIDSKRNIFGKRKVYVKGGSRKLTLSPVELAVQAERMGAGEIMINSIDHEGKMQGYDIELIKEVSEAVQIPVVGCGGAGTLSDFKKVTVQGNANAVAAGSLFVFHGKRNGILINYPQKKDLLELFS